MSDEEVRRNNRHNPLDSIETVGAAALAIGTGAALLYRGGGSQVLSSGLRKASKALNETLNTMSNMALRDYNAEGFSGLAQGFKRAYDEADGAFTLRTDSPKSIFTHFIEGQNRLNNNVDIYKLFNQQKMVKPLQDSLQSKYGNNDPQRIKRISAFSRNAFKSLEDTFKFEDEYQTYALNNDFVNKHFGDSLFNATEQAEMMNELVETVKRRKTELPEFLANSENLKFNITNQSRDINLLTEKFGRLGMESSHDAIKNLILGDRPATINNILEHSEGMTHQDLRRLFRHSTEDPADILAAMRAKRDENPEFGNLFIDKDNLRYNEQNGIYSFDELSKAKDTFWKGFKQTLPGKMFKLTDVLSVRSASTFHLTAVGEADPILAKLAENRKSSIVNNSYMRILNKTYQIKEDGSLEHIERLDNTYLISGQHGTVNRQLRHMSGDIDRRPDSNNWLLNALELNTSATPNFIKSKFSTITKFNDERWGRNVLNSFLDLNVDQFNLMATTLERSGSVEARDVANDYMTSYMNKAKELDKLMGETTKPLSRSASNRLFNTATNQNVKRMFGLLTQTDDDMMDALLQSHESTSYVNKELESLVSQYKKSPKNAMETMSIVTDNKGMTGETRAVYFKEMVKKEVAKEAFLRHSSVRGSKVSVTELLKNSGLSGDELKEAQYLANWGFLKDAGNLYRATYSTYTQDVVNNAREIQRLFNGPSQDVKVFRESIRASVFDKVSVMQKGFQKRDNLIEGQPYQKYVYMQKSFKVTDVLKNLNDFTMAKAYAKQFVAGRNNMENVTTATMFPYFALARLLEPIEQFGIGLSNKSSGNVVDLAAGIFFKRVMPIAGTMAALSYLNFETENLTGTSLKAAAANSWANFDLSRHKLSDKTGLTNIFKTEYQLNPMAQYWNNEEYQTYEERAEWYKNGYSPVRKGRWWSFGSASEFRGGKIDYYEPNSVRQANSNWQDIGIYGSSDEKWKHSWIPTPRHPLSPLRALLDPYWLERKHYNDRPYPVTGKMFEEGTPWGAILNPTIGQILKPQKRMHQETLGDKLVDVRTLIENENNRVKNRSNSIVRIDGSGDFTPVSYVPLSTAREAIIRDGNGNGSGFINGNGVSSNFNLMGINEFEGVHDAIQQAATGEKTVRSYSSAEVSGLSLASQIRISADRGNPFATIATGLLPLEIISKVNRTTMYRSTLAPRGGSEGIMLKDAIYKEKSTWGEVEEGDLRNLSTTKEFLQDAGYSAKELLGMYGFIYEELMPGNKSQRLQGAERMTSFSRRFWDSSVGGLGGEFMEIARRFVPHEDHSIDRINTIKNTMPEWMPGRFKTGDPFEKLPKGEMRLPGAAYEDLNTLHPDQYGTYGAFDRMKILADVAPWSREYRMWRDIAKKTVQDEALQNEMDAIKHRAEKAAQSHTFYPYKFKGSDMVSSKAVVDTVGRTKFTVVGSTKEYRMAGMDFAEGNISDYLKPGTGVTLQYGKKEANQKDLPVIVMVEGTNLNRELMNSGKATPNDDTTSAGLRARFTPSQIERGKVYETLAHLPIPLIHNKFMRVNSPLESWDSEQLYGTQYATWSHPIQGFIEPAFREAFAVSTPHALLGMTAWGLNEYTHRAKSTAGKMTKGLARASFLMTNPGGFTGSVIGMVSTLHDGAHVRLAGNVGAAIGAAGFLYTHSNNPLFATGSGAVLGTAISEQLFKGTGKTGAMVGAISGLAISALKNPDFNWDRMTGPWIPKNVEKKWEIEEYYDRLRYIKYMGLYHKAARLAKSKEGIDIEKVVNKFEYDSKKREKIKIRLLRSQKMIESTYAENDPKKSELLAEIDEKLSKLAYPETILKAGKYTKSALAYKQAAESTIYGLDGNSSWSQILRAVPKYERDYIMEFGKETDPGRRKEILKHLSPYRRRALENLWKVEQSKVESNESYFAHHKLPSMFWGGWRPNVDLDNVEIKTIKNEGMLLSDFGFYESQAEEPEAMAAPAIDYDESTSPLNLKKNMITALNGMGLTGVEVSIEPTEAKGIQLIANILRIGDYKIKSAINSIIGGTAY